ncbi:MAG: hypothetical protein INQ03_02295 [Candidatus Heimdallarchaeota archaeon]|nr:hypothetical protein [Candidatus Heimdallarchaeota archaeon]
MDDEKDKELLNAYKTLQEFQKSPDISEQDDTNDNMEQFWDIFNVDERIISYFIFTMYAYLDVYFDDIFTLMLKNSTEDFDNYITKYQKNSNPYQNFTRLLKGNANYIKKNILEYCDKELLSKAKTTLNLLNEIRNKIAHKEPTVPFSTIFQNFPDEFENTKDKINDERDKIMKIEDVDQLTPSQIELSSKLMGMFTNWFEQTHHLFILESILEPVLQILILFDKIIYQITNKSK